MSVGAFFAGEGALGDFLPVDLAWLVPERLPLSRLAQALPPRRVRARLITKLGAHRGRRDGTALDVGAGRARPIPRRRGCAPPAGRLAALGYAPPDTPRLRAFPRVLDSERALAGGSGSTAHAEIERRGIDALCRRLCAPGAVDMRDRVNCGRNCAACFVGEEAARWMMRICGRSPEEATRLGQRLVDLSLLHHVLDAQEFVDGYLFYRFYADEKS
ncbi:MAG: DEP domain-containing protein [Burkholderiales bacterium]|nr:DEP domain-containing protein [Burkholderiales bacterium]